MNFLTPEYGEWGKTVKKTLIDRDITIKELSDALGVSRWTIYNSVNGKQPNEKTTKRISEYLGIPVP